MEVLKGGTLMTKLRIFVASPSDVVEERNIVSMVVEELRRSLGELLGIELVTIRWETHTWPDVGDDAQDVINKQIGEYDVLVGMMWKPARQRLGLRYRSASVLGVRSVIVPARDLTSGSITCPSSDGASCLAGRVCAANWTPPGPEGAQIQRTCYADPATIAAGQPLPVH